MISSKPVVPSSFTVAWDVQKVADNGKRLWSRRQWKATRISTQTRLPQIREDQYAKDHEEELFHIALHYSEFKIHERQENKETSSG